MWCNYLVTKQVKNRLVDALINPTNTLDVLSDTIVSVK